jgi:LuxR family quorum-sensing system transcriptional regulator SinR
MASLVPVVLGFGSGEASAIKASLITCGGLVGGSNAPLHVDAFNWTVRPVSKTNSSIENEVKMPSLDDFDLRPLTGLDAELSDARLDGVIEKIRDHYGLAHIAYVCPAFRGRSIAHPFIALTYSEAWVEHYQAEGYHFIDPVTFVGARSVLPFDWAFLPRFEARVRNLFGEAHEAGVGSQGLTVPVRGPARGLWALFTVTSYDSDAQWEARRSELSRDMAHVAHYVHQHAFELHGEGSSANSSIFAFTEIEALQWIAEGAEIEEIACAMGTAAEAVKAYLDSARYKLQALNRSHAIRKAIRAGLIV